MSFFSFSQDFLSVQFSRSVVSDSLQPHESQHARPPCPSPSPGVHSNHSLPNPKLLELPPCCHHYSGKHLLTSYVAFSMRPFWVHTRNLSLPPLSHHSIYHLPILTSITLYCSCLAQAQDIHYTKFCSSFKAPSLFCFMKQWYSFLLFCDHVVDGTREFGPSKPSGFGYFALAIPFRKPIG